MTSHDLPLVCQQSREGLGSLDKIRILGSEALNGDVSVKGAKNAALPAPAATLLSDRQITLWDIPRVRDVDAMVRPAPASWC